ncbi:ATP-binding cassette domain-containing protein [Lapidilactobacillus salsurivasis]
MLQIDGIAMRFKEKQVLTNASLTLQPGEVAHISGANGSGKSTLFKVIVGLLAPTAGSVVKGDADVFGALIENPGFFEFETLALNLKFLAELRGTYNLPWVKELSQILRLDLDNKDKMGKFSVGMRQKAGIIQAVMEDQSIILLDEPTRGLDEPSLAGFSDLIAKLANQGKSVLIASHDIIPSVQYQRMYLLEDGLLVANNEN